MSNKSNNQGRAYEYIFLNSLFEVISKIREVSIEKNSSLMASKQAWETLSSQDKEIYKKSALTGVSIILDLEPLIIEKSNDILNLKIQSDDEGKKGDVRDIVIMRGNIDWEIGLSLKHNHFAVKHSRLSKKLDFGEKWYGIPCSEEYWKKVKPIFDFLEEEKEKKTLWKEIVNKNEDVYFPLLEAFKIEILDQNRKNIKLLENMLKYLLGKFDFYKVISIDNKKVTRVQSYNLYGTLNQDGVHEKRKIEIPIIILPTRIVSLDFKPNSLTTLELYLNNGWQFTFRIHNAEKEVKPSLKFDIQIVGMPTSIISIDSKWEL
jgi:type-2 restriction enzyme haeIII